jgi:hypothetical protein
VVEGVPSEMINVNDSISFMVPHGTFYSRIDHLTNQENRKLINLTNFVKNNL